MKIRLVTVVWGDFFVDIFLRVTVRSLLGAGNAVDLAKRHSVIYTIQTTQEYRERLEASPQFQELASLVTIDFQVFDPAELNPADLAQHWFFWRQVASIARPNRELLFFIIPDMLFAAGTLMRWAGFFEEGRHAVWSAVPQVVLETSLEELEAKYPASSGTEISMDVQNVHSFFLRQIHPYMLAMLRDGRHWLRHPEVVFKSVPGEGLAMRAICSHLFCIDLNHFSLTDAFSPVDRLDDIAYDDLSHGVCLERMMKHTDLYYYSNRMDDDRLSNLGKWLDDFCTPADFLESYHTYRFCGQPPANNKAFRKAVSSLGFYACQVRLTGAIYRTIRAIRSAGCSLGARAVAVAHYAARLRRHWRIKGEITVFVPTDAALQAMDGPRLNDLLSSGQERTLIDVVLGHVTPGKLSFAVGDQVVRRSDGSVSMLSDVTGKSIRIDESGPGAQIVAGPIDVDDCLIYVIDRPLKWPRPKAEQLPRQAMLPVRWASSPRRVMMPVVLPSASTPASAAPASLAVLPIAARLKEELRKIPGVYAVLRKLASGLRFGLAVLRMARQQPRTFVKRVAASLKYRAGRVVRMVLQAIKSRLRAAAGEIYHLALQLPVAGWVAIRLRNRYLSWRHTRAAAAARAELGAATMVSVPSEGTDQSRIVVSVNVKERARPLADEALSAFCDIQAARAVLNLEELLSFYKDKVGDLVPDYPPLNAARSCLRQAQIDNKRLIAELRSVLTLQPEFAEAWLELGHAYYEDGKFLAAEQAWTECLASEEYLTVPGDRVGCKALAAWARAKSLEARGRHAAAVESYKIAVGLDVRLRLAHLANAKLLRKLGRIDEAAAEFEASLDTDGSALAFPSLPRMFDALASRLKARFADAKKVGSENNQPALAVINSGSAA